MIFPTKFRQDFEPINYSSHGLHWIAGVRAQAQILDNGTGIQIAWARTFEGFVLDGIGVLYT